MIPGSFQNNQKFINRLIHIFLLFMKVISDKYITHRSKIRNNVEDIY